MNEYYNSYRSKNKNSEITIQIENVIELFKITTNYETRPEIIYTIRLRNYLSLPNLKMIRINKINFCFKHKFYSYLYYFFLFFYNKRLTRTQISV